MLAVGDTGSGMTHDIQSQMFEPFFSTKATNMGLGLTLVHGMIRQHGGTVDVESHLGRGTTVRVFFPIEPRTGPVQQRGGSTGPVSRSHETILIVESDEIERKLAVATLNRQRYRVLEAESAVQALMVAQQHAGSIHLAVSNLSMEDISGRELVRRLVVVPSEDEGSVRLRVHGRDDGASPLEYATASTGQLLAG
jgi:CheY-like chemotaxis protein